MIPRLPSQIIAAAECRGVQRKIAIKIGGGLGDQACAIPALKHASHVFKDSEIVLSTLYPELFSSTGFGMKYDIDEEDHLIIESYPFDAIRMQYLNPNLMDTIDYCGLNINRTVPVDKKITLPKMSNHLWEKINKQYIVVHPGSGWASKTFPTEWWNEVISKLVKKCDLINKKVVIVGNKNKTVDIRFFSTVLDWRDETSVSELVWLCENAWGLISNDSSPIHLVSYDSNTRIAFIPTCKRPDLLCHGRNRTRAIYKEPMWLEWNHAPNHLDVMDLSVCPRPIENYLPNPQDLVDLLMVQMA